MSRRDPWEAAVCRQDTYYEWAREHRASMWDWHVDGETPVEKRVRLQRAQRLCGKCPLQLECIREYKETAKASSLSVSGVWGGKIHAEKSPDDRNDNPSMVAA